MTGAGVCVGAIPGPGRALSSRFGGFCCASGRSGRWVAEVWGRPIPFDPGSVRGVRIVRGVQLPSLCPPPQLPVPPEVPLCPIGLAGAKVKTNRRRGEYCWYPLLMRRVM
jgi:hypothetical protein